MARRSTFGPLTGIPDPLDRRSRPGAPVPLLERLVDDDPAAGEEPRPYTSFEIEGLEQSVARELSRLLNTRAPIDAETLDKRSRSVIDYGVPDFSTFSADGPEGTDRFARHVEAAIAAYEPRLDQAKVTIRRDESTRLPQWVAVIDGVLKSGGIVEPVNITITDFQGSGGG